MKIAITGHRPNKLGNDYDLTSPLIIQIKEKLQEVIDTYQPTEMISGMALGIDTLWAELAIENKIKLIAAIPFINQHIKWTPRSQLRYTNILSNKLTTKINVIDDYDYKPLYMQERNIWMVNHCDILVAVWDGSDGGTHNCVQYANNKKPIIRINPNNITETQFK